MHSAQAAGESLIPLHEGAIQVDHIVGEIGELLLSKIPVRQSALDIRQQLTFEQEAA